MYNHFLINMNWAKVSFFFIISCHFLGAQEYFQQDVQYVIEASLNDEEDVLTAKISLTYVNNSKEDLSEIYFHLYPNAFKDANSFFAKDQIRRGQNELYFANEKERGGFKSISFDQNGQQLNIENWNGYDDVVRVDLNTKLASGEQTDLQIDFELKVPKIFSRLGKEDQSYHFVHWYPRPVVYDINGWNPSHYGVVGEFYGEYGNYLMTLTLPKDYLVAHTGNGVSEKKNSSDTTKIFTFSAAKVHDFAFMISKGYRIENAQFDSQDGRKIATKIFTRKDKEDDAWEDAMIYLKRSFDFYEENVGPYPYDHISLVQAGELGHGNMEYPELILVRGDEHDLEYYINHELGHMWFFGALGFNEYKESWLDEGLTTFFEHRYTMQQQGRSHYSEEANAFVRNTHDMEALHAYIISHSRNQMNQRADTPINEMTDINYGIRSYEMAARYYLYLQEYLGKGLFDDLIRGFYEQWKYKHPTAKDLKQYFEEGTDKDLSWFFDGLLISDEFVDFRINSVKKVEGGHEVLIENKSNHNIPIALAGKRKGETVWTQWIEPFTDVKSINVDREDVEVIHIDEGNLTLDINPSDNHIRTSGVFKKLEPLRFTRLFSTDRSNQSDLFFTLMGGFNTSDGFYVGPGFLNQTAPTKNFSFDFFPQYAFETKNLVGQGKLQYTLQLKNDKIKSISAKLGIKSYHFSDFLYVPADEEYNLRYAKIQPELNVRFRHSPMSRTQSGLDYRFIYLYEEELDFSLDIAYTYNNFGINKLRYWNRRSNGLTKKAYSFDLEHQIYSTPFSSEEKESYTKLTFVGDRTFYYDTKKTVQLRLFAAGFLQNTRRESSNFNNQLTRGSIPLFAGGHNDYLYDGQFMNRRDQDEKRFFLNQIGNHGGGFKHALGSSYRLGNSNNFLISLNASSSLPIDLPSFLRPLRVFMDAAYYSTKSVENDPLENKFLYSMGLSYDLKYLQIHLPLFYSNEIDVIYKSEDIGFLQRITFLIDLPKLDFDSVQGFREH